MYVHKWIQSFPNPFKFHISKNRYILIVPCYLITIRQQVITWIDRIQYKLSASKSMLSNLFFSFFGYRKFDDPQEYILLSYRSNIIKKLPTTYYTSDSGWGCMLRVAQMAIANLLYKQQSMNKTDILKLFWDNSNAPFSIQTLTAISPTIYPQKKPYDWYSPCQIGFILKTAVQNYSPTYKVCICNDNSIFLSDIPRDWPKVIILVMCRIGLDEPQTPYLQTVIRLTKTQYFFSILGGTPKYAHLFIKQKEGYFGYLDPHSTQKAAENETQLLKKEKQYTGKLEWVKKQKISSSMALMFVCARNQIADFWRELTELKSERGSDFFLYMEQERPVFDDDDGIEIVEIMDLK